MPLRRCSACHQRLADKPVSIYWAWNNDEGVRVAHRSILCDGCFREHVGPVIDHDNNVEILTCPQCGIDTETDYSAVYGTAYVPGYGEVTIEAPFCAACAMHYRTWAQSASTPLEDRRGAEDEAPRRVSSDQVYRALGRTSRAG